MIGGAPAVMCRSDAFNSTTRSRSMSIDIGGLVVPSTGLAIGSPFFILEKKFEVA